MIWYNNSQGAAVTTTPPDVSVPASGNFIFTSLDIPASGDREVMLLSDFTVCVENSGYTVLDVWAQIGVSNPSEDDFPMKPFVGVMHAIARAKIAPGTMAMLHVIRLDVINPLLLPTDIPWKLVGKPRLAPQLFAPAGTKLCNCAARVVMIG